MSAPSPQNPHQRLEQHDGLRFPWNVIPTSQPQGKSVLPLPISSSYTPFAQLDSTPVLPYKPIECNTCKSILNPFCQINFPKKSWKCPLCLQENDLPVSYNTIQPTYLPAELQTENTTVEYVLPPPNPGMLTSLDPNQPALAQKLTTERYPTFVFVIDTAIEMEELSALKKNIIQAVATLPPGTTVALITFGKNIELHELSCNFSTSRSYCIRGNINDVNTLDERIGYALQRVPVESLIAPIELCELHFLQILESIETDPWENDEILFRPERATGVALYTALHLITNYSKYCYNINKRDIGIFPRVCLFIGGISTRGIGSSASIQRTSHLRSHAALLKEKPAQTLFHQSISFYHHLAYKSLHGIDSKPPEYDPKLTNFEGLFGTKSSNTNQFGVNSILNPLVPKVSYDVFACCLDQIGLAELAPLIEHTNGMLVMDDSFTRGVFRGSLKQYFATGEDVLDQSGQNVGPDGQNNQNSKELFQFAFNAIFETSVSRHLEVCYSVGNISPLPARTVGVKNLSNLNNVKKMTPNVTAVTPTVYNSLINLSTDVPFTNTYYINTLSPHTTVSTIFMPVVTLDIPQLNHDKAYGNHVYFQYRTNYRDALGRNIIRVTTISRPYIELARCLNHNQEYTQMISTMRSNFDQHAALAVMTKLGLTYVKNHYPLDVTRWYDSILLEFGRRYGFYQSNNMNTFTFSPEMSSLLHMTFHLRRSQLFDLFNSSPDETAFFRLSTLPQSTSNILLIIEPALIQYTMNSSPETVPLDPSVLDSKKILFLDTFFHIVIWYGNHIAQWKEQELHLKPEFQYLNDMIRAPLLETKQRLNSRFPTPRYIECVERGSQSRFLMAKLNPVEIPMTESQQQQQQQLMYGGANVGDGNGQQPEKDIFSEAQSLQDYTVQFKQVLGGNAKAA
jgi:protein transport protein SEC23